MGEDDIHLLPFNYKQFRLSKIAITDRSPRSLIVRKLPVALPLIKTPLKSASLSGAPHLWQICRLWEYSLHTVIPSDCNNSLPQNLQALSCVIGSATGAEEQALHSI